jgi:hypothetical protein
MKRILIIAVLVILFIAGFIGYRMYSEETADVVNKKPDEVTDVKNLIAAFDQDTASASKRYINRIVEVTGTVMKVDTSGSVVLGEEGSASAVVVGLDRRHISDHKQLKPGSIAVIQGICSGYSKGSGDDLLASLGTTVELKSAGVKDKK